MIDDIRYAIVFAKIVATGSISAGAEALGLSTATASAHLGKLEKNLGVALLYRNTRKLSLTTDGAQLYETASAMLALYESGLIEFKQRSMSTQQHLRLALPSILVNHPQFNQALADFVHQHPQATLALFYSDVRSDIISEQVDVALRIGDLPDSSFKARHLFSLARSMVAHPQWQQQHPPITTPPQLASLPWIGLHMLPSQRQLQHVVTGEQVLVCYQAKISVDNVEAAYRLACAGMGVSTPPTFLCQAALGAGTMQVLLPDWAMAPIQVHALWPNNVASSSIAYALVQHLHQAFTGRLL